MDAMIPCQHCQATIPIMASQVGRPLRCPHCHQTFITPDPGGAGPLAKQGKRFTFACSRCRSRLEAYTGLVGKTGQCPTCGTEFVIPAPNQAARPTGNAPQEAESDQPIHAYAAAGDNAPHLVRLKDGQRRIRCPRCETLNHITANNCTKCAVAFTLDGAEPVSAGGKPLASVICGAAGLPLAFLVLPSILAIAYGAASLRTANAARPAERNMAITGMILGFVGIAIAAALFLRP